MKSGHYVTDTRGPMTLDLPMDIGLNGTQIAALADNDDPYGIDRLIPLGSAAASTFSGITALEATPEWAARFKDEPGLVDQIKALAPDRPWYRHNDSNIRRISALDVFGEESQRTAYIFVFTLRE